MSDRLRQQHPQEITIILQHQFWDLAVTDEHFEVGLSFNGVPEKLVVPFEAVKGFFDPSVQFGLQFETIEAPAGTETEPSDVSEQAEQHRLARKPTRPPAPLPVPANPDGGLKLVEPSSDKPGSDKTMGEVVRLDRFRKK